MRVGVRLQRRDELGQKSRNSNQKIKPGHGTRRIRGQGRRRRDAVVRFGAVPVGMRTRMPAVRLARGFLGLARLRTPTIHIINRGAVRHFRARYRQSAPNQCWYRILQPLVRCRSSNAKVFAQRAQASRLSPSTLRPPP